jgi:hypothetical protein
LKISVLVAQYFYQHRVLNLPDIGSFYLDDVVDVQSIGDKSSRDLLEHIHFAQKKIARPDEELIDFIRKHTGKIKPLAESDLETFIADGKLMLNIGKPFHIEGIGTLHKNKEGIYEFTPGHPVVQRLESPPPLTQHEQVVETPFKTTRSTFGDDPNEARNASYRRAAIGIGLVIGLGIIIWGGYSLFSKKVTQTSSTVTATTGNEEDSQRTSQYLRNIDNPKKALAEVLNKDSMLIADSGTVASPILPAPGVKPTPTPTGSTKMYKYVLQTTKYKATAESMYNKLKPRVQLEAVDSTLFKIVISVPGTPADTTRIKDSLRFWYWGSREKQIRIEQ